MIFLFQDRPRSGTPQLWRLRYHYLCTIHFACWPDLFFLLLPWQPALCEFPVTLHRRSLLSVLPAFCFQPRTRQGTLQTLAQCPCVHEHEVWGVDTPWVKPLVLGSRGQWVNLLCTMLGLTALQCNSFGFFKGEVFLSKWGGISVQGLCREYNRLRFWDLNTINAVHRTTWKSSLHLWVQTRQSWCLQRLYFKGQFRAMKINQGFSRILRIRRLKWM